MKDWIVVYIIPGANEPSVIHAQASNIRDAIMFSGLDIESIVSAQCVNTQVKP